MLPGSHVPEREYWSCAGVESLVFFPHVSTVKGRKILIVCGCTRNSEQEKERR